MKRFLKHDIKGEVDSHSQIIGRVDIQKETRVINSLIRGPVSIAKRCEIKNSSIRPFTSVGADTIIEDSHPEYPVILEHSHICQIEHLKDSLIDKKIELKK